MALELKKITQDLAHAQKQSEEDIGEESEDIVKHPASLKLPEDPQWVSFCNKELKVHETKWTKKLEQYGPEDHKTEGDNEGEEEEEDDSNDEPEGFRMQPGRGSGSKKGKNRGQGRYDTSDQSQEDKEEEESSIGEMLNTGALKKTLLAHRNKVYIRPSADELKKGQEDSQEGGDGDDDEEDDDQRRFDQLLEKTNEIVESPG